MRYKIFDNGEEINVIEADAAFCENYCAEMGYTYEADPLPGPEQPNEEEPSTEEVLLEIAADHEARLCEIELGVN